MSGARGVAVAALLAGASLLAAPLAAHEYWLDPLDATPDAGGRLFANVRNGQDFAGTSLPYDPARMARLELVGADGARAVAARLGDFPAVQTDVGEAGVHVLLLDTHGKALVYDDLARFTEFLAYHGLEGRLAEHARRGLPERGIREIYFRHAKALVRAGGPGGGAPDGDGAGASGPYAPRGQPFELVPLEDPWASGTLSLALLSDGEPFPGAQVELFERTPDGAVTRTLARSDAAGRVRLDVSRPGEYLVNAVRLTEPGAEAREAAGDAPAHWESRWASLTFERDASAAR